MTAYERIVRALQAAGNLVEVPDAAPPDILGVTEDSRRVEEGWLFCAIEGTVEDGHAYLPDAVSRGAAAVIVTRRTDLPVPQLVVDDARRATAIAAAEWFGRPADELELVGVTGTNGKSTTVGLIRHVLNRGGDTGSIGTLGAFDGRGASLYQEGLTTPGPVQFQETLSRLRAAGVRRVAMEVSSHALDQGRIDEVSVLAAVFTNLTHEHLDYHASPTEYFRAKARLAGLVKEGGTLVVNADDPQWKALPTVPKGRRVTYGVHADATVGARRIELGPDGTTFEICVAGVPQPIRTPLLGEFNVSNTLAAAATAWSLGEPLEEIVARLADAPQIPGRMEPLVSDQFLILRDYAHTPDALRRAMAAARALTSTRLVVLFGCGGDRDRGKRAVMGKMAAAESDLAIVTSDNPRTEDPDRIIDDILEGMGGKAHMRITNRREAIERAVGLLRDGDCLLLAGKGHETYQVIGTERTPFDEREIVLAALAAS